MLFLLGAHCYFIIITSNNLLVQVASSDVITNQYNGIFQEAIKSLEVKIAIYSFIIDIDMTLIGCHGESHSKGSTVITVTERD
jgi:hypothetical protein